ncbi:MAG: c-type cytochrome [Desulfoferrobacter sp.]
MIDSWINAFYAFLNSLGYPHPVHPTQAHMPIGLVVGAFVFCLGAILLHRAGLFRTAHNCLILALFFWFPTVLFGLMDWQHFYQGAWLFAFKVKMILAAVLFVLLLAGILLARRDEPPGKLIVTIYAACFLTVTGLGYFGGVIVFAGKSQPEKQYQAGAKLYETNCNGCHPNGGNVIDANKPVQGSPKLSDFNTFLSWIRSPVAPMPAFPESAVSKEQAMELYDYVTHVIDKK